MRLDGADAVVVGGGILGICAAWFLAEEGLDVVLVEQHRLAHGASGRNQGFVWQATHEAGIALELCQAGRALYEELAEVLGAGTFGLRPSGGLIHVHSEAQARMLAEFVAARRQDGVPIELIDVGQARRLAPMLPLSTAGAAFCSDEAQIVAPRFVAALGRACRRRGVRIYEHTSALGLMRSGSSVAGVQTVRGEVAAQAVAWCTGPWIEALRHSGVELPLVPERLTAALTGPVPERLGALLYGPVGIPGCSLFTELPSYQEEDYAVVAGFGRGHTMLEGLERGQGQPMFETVAQTEGGRLLIGCAVDRPQVIDERPPAGGVAAMLELFGRRFPQYARLGIERIWAGVLAATPDGLPILSAVDSIDGLWLSTGHGFGNASGPIAGRLLAQMVLGAEPALDVTLLSLNRTAQSPSRDGVPIVRS